MAVERNKQRTSNLEWYHHGLMIRNQILPMLLRDFGVKLNPKKLDVIKDFYHFNDEDFQIVLRLAEKYRIAEVTLFEYPGWFVEDARKNILSIMKSFILNLHYADDTPVKNEHTFYIREQYVRNAKTDMVRMADEFEYVMKVIDINMKMYMPILDAIQYEIRLLNRLMKMDQSAYKRYLRNKEKKKSQEAARESKSGFNNPDTGETYANMAQIVPAPGDETKLPGQLANPFDQGSYELVKEKNKVERKPVKMVPLGSGRFENKRKEISDLSSKH